MTNTERDNNARALYNKAASISEQAVKDSDFATFFKYQPIVYRILQYRINLLRR